MASCIRGNETSRRNSPPANRCAVQIPRAPVPPADNKDRHSRFFAGKRRNQQPFFPLLPLEIRSTAIRLVAFRQRREVRWNEMQRGVSEKETKFEISPSEKLNETREREVAAP